MRNCNSKFLSRKIYKILGSFHIAFGNSHDLRDNDYRASIHWDIVNMITLEYNGGKIILDDELIQKM